MATRDLRIKITVPGGIKAQNVFKNLAKDVQQIRSTVKTAIPPDVAHGLGQMNQHMKTMVTLQKQVASGMKNISSTVKTMQQRTFDMRWSLKSMLRDVEKLMLFQARWYAGRAALFAIVGVPREAITSYAEWEQAIRNAGAVSEYTDEQLRGLKDTTLEIGRSTPISAQESASALLEFAQAGIDATVAMKALPVAAKMVVATQEDMKSAVSALTTAYYGWKLSADEMIDAGDAIAAAMADSSLMVKDLGTVFNYLASQSNLANISLEDTLTMVTVLSKAGVKASTIGTGLSQALIAFTQMTPKLQKQIRAVGLTVDEVRVPHNNFLDVLIKLKKAGFDLTKVFTGLTARAGRSVGAVLNQGVTMIEETAEKIRQKGILEQMFGKAMEGVENRAKQLINKFKNVAIKLGEDLAPAIKTALDLAHDFADALSVLFGEFKLGETKIPEMTENTQRLAIALLTVKSVLDALWVGMKNTLTSGYELIKFLAPYINKAGGVKQIAIDFASGKLRERWEESYKEIIGLQYQTNEELMGMLEDYVQRIVGMKVDFSPPTKEPDVKTKKDEEDETPSTYIPEDSQKLLQLMNKSRQIADAIYKIRLKTAQLDIGRAYQKENAQLNEQKALLRAQFDERNIGLVEYLRKTYEIENKAFQFKIDKIKKETDVALEEKQKQIDTAVSLEEKRYSESLALVEGGTKALSQHIVESKNAEDAIKRLRMEYDLLAKQGLAKEEIESNNHRLRRIKDIIKNIRNILMEEIPETGVLFSLKDLANKWGNVGQQMYDMTTNIATGMANNFKTLFIDVTSGNMKTFKDYLTGFLDSFRQAFVNMLVEIMMSGLIGWLTDVLGVKMQMNIQDMIAKTNTDSLTASLSAQIGVVTGLTTAYKALGVAKAFAGVATGGAGGGATGGGLPIKGGGGTYHSGGVVGGRGDVPIIAQSGEGIVSRKGMKNLENINSGKLGETNVRINIDNQTSSQIEAEQADAKFDAEGLVIGIILKNINEGGILHRTLQRGR